MPVLSSAGLRQVAPLRRLLRQAAAAQNQPGFTGDKKPFELLRKRRRAAFGDFASRSYSVGLLRASLGPAPGSLRYAGV